MQFEVPYNFDTTLIDFLIGFNNTKDISAFYISPFLEDASPAKRFYISTVHPGIANSPKTREEYEYHVKYAQNAGLPVTGMFQHPIDEPSDEILNYYVNTLGINKFIVTRNNVAKRIRALKKDVYLIASIVKRSSLEQINNGDLKDFDNVVLWFPFNRNINWIREITANIEITVLVNCTCSPNCDGMHHWYAGDERLSRISSDCNLEILEQIAPLKVDMFSEGSIEGDTKDSCPHDRKDSGIFIPPSALFFFEKAGVTHFKLQGREFSTNFLISDIRKYLGGDVRRSMTTSGLEMTELFKQGLEKYYNIGTPEIKTGYKFDGDGIL